jgi:hypothetical protein
LDSRSRYVVGNQMVAPDSSSQRLCSERSIKRLMFRCALPGAVSALGGGSFAAAVVEGEI